MLLLSKTVNKGDSEVSFKFRFPPLSSENEPGSIKLDTFYLTAEIEKASMTFSLETESLVLTTTSQSNFLRMAIVAIGRLVESKLKRLDGKKYWSRTPIFKLTEDTTTRGVLGRVYLSLPSGTYFYSSRYELLALLGFDSADILGISGLGMEEIGDGYYVANDSHYPRPSSQATEQTVQTNQIKLGLRGDEMSWAKKVEGVPADLGENLKEAVTFGFVRPGHETYGLSEVELEIDPVRSLSELAVDMNKHISMFMYDHNLMSGPRFTNSDGVMELYAGPGKQNYQLGIKFSENLVDFLKFSDPIMVDSDVRIKTLIGRGGKTDTPETLTLVPKNMYPVSVHSRTAVINSYMSELGLTPCIALLTKNHTVGNIESIPFLTKGGEKTVQMNFLNKHNAPVTFTSDMTIHAVFTHI